MLDITFAGAALAGLLSFLTPCVLPMVPFYLSYLAGAGVQQLAAGQQIDPALRRRAFLGALCFSAGVITIFVGFGATATVFGQMVRDYIGILRWLAAAVILLMGLHFLGVIRIGILYRQLNTEIGETANVSLAGAFVIGLAFAFGWTPCVGPALASILFMAGAADTATKGAALLMTYGLGMTLPFVLAALFIGPFMKWMAGFRRHLGLVEKAMGVLLVIFAILIATEKINVIAAWMLSIAPDIGTLR
jgi:cytochrome c-type biogenesis protein